MDDLQPVQSFFKPGSSVLELGCGAGRLTRKLMEMGVHVTAVDESTDMLGEIHEGVHAVLSSIESLKLDRRFDSVLLASCLINHPVQQVRDSFVSSAARHMKPGATLLIQRHDADWLRAAQTGSIGQGASDVMTYLERVTRRGSIVDMTLRYEFEEGTWTHTFSAEVLTQDQIEDLLRTHGVERVSWHGRANQWAVGSMGRNRF